MVWRCRKVCWWCLRSPSPSATTMVANMPSGPMACCTSPWATVAWVATLRATAKTGLISWEASCASMVPGLTPDQGYRVPPDNPFAGSTDARGEVWANGLTYLFDRENGDLWAGDEGQNSFEEVDLVVKGGNYCWKAVIASPHGPNAAHLAHYAR